MERSLAPGDTLVRFEDMTNIEDCACISLRVMSSGWVLTVQWGTSDEQFRSWTDIRAAILKKAFQGRDALALTESPLQSSWTREVVRLFDWEEGTVIYGGVEAHVVRIEDCQPDLLVEAGTDDEFARGLLWFSYPAGAMHCQAAEILMARISSRTEIESLCSRKYEILSCEGDGSEVVWCRPSLGLDEFVGWLRELCAKEEFEVVVDV